MHRRQMLLLMAIVAGLTALGADHSSSWIAGVAGSQTQTCATDTATVVSGGEVVETACATPLLPLVKFVSPQSGTTWDGGFALSATEINEMPLELLSDAVFEYSPDGGANFFPIDSVAARKLDFETVWETTGLNPGDYLVRVTLSDIVGNTSSDTITLHVNAEPVPTASFACQGTTAIQFNAVVADANPGANIVSYSWDFGDGSPNGTGQAVSHTYAAPGIYFIELAVTDNLGAIGLSDFGLSTTVCLVIPKGCDPVKMDVMATNPPGASWPFPPSINNTKQLGLFTDPALPAKAADWAAALGTFWIRDNFEVVTTLKANSDPSKCKEGQNTKATRTYGKIVDGKEFSETKKWRDFKAGANPYDAALLKQIDCGFTDTDWCDDDYHSTTHKITKIADAEAGWVKVHVDESEIRWLDAPGSRVTKNQINADGGYTYATKFRAAVKGDTKTVQCSWEVIRTVTVGGALVPAVGGAGVSNIACQIQNNLP